MNFAIFICSMLDDDTRIERKIFSDSPAASKKVFGMARALKSKGTQPIILSMGRGKTNGSLTFFKGKLRYINGVIVIYAPFCHFKLISYLLTFLSMPILLIKVYGLTKNFNSALVCIFYNRTSAYISSLITARYFNIKCVLDLEDIELIDQAQTKMQRIYQSIKQNLYNRLCSGGTILAASVMEKSIPNEKSICYYGIASNEPKKQKILSKNKIKILFGGSVQEDTGSEILYELITKLREKTEKWCENIEFVVTGQGSGIDRLQPLTEALCAPNLTIHGRLNYADYLDILHECDIGLALKKNNGLLAKTTFPSKVIEYASAGLLNVTTEISDVKKVLEDGAVYVTEDTAIELVNALKNIAENPSKFQEIAELGNKLVIRKCSVDQARINLKNFLFDEDHK